MRWGIRGSKSQSHVQLEGTGSVRSASGQVMCAGKQAICADFSRAHIEILRKAVVKADQTTFITTTNDCRQSMQVRASLCGAKKPYFWIKFELFRASVAPLESVEPSRCLLTLLGGEWGNVKTQLGRAPRHITTCCSRAAQWTIQTIQQLYVSRDGKCLFTGRRGTSFRAIKGKTGQ